MDVIAPRRHDSSAATVRRLAVALTALLILTLPLATRATAAPALRTVTFAGATVHVPASWPIVRLGRDPRACVRFDRHAVYLGRPGAHASCPGHLAGRTEAILIEPAGGRPGLGRGTPAVLVRHTAAADVYATWEASATTIRRAVGVRALPQPPRSRPALGPRAARAAADRAAARVAGGRRAADRATTNRDTTPSGGTGTSTTTTTTSTPAPAGATPGQTYTGPGFDACSAPSQSQMDAWASSPYRALGVYIGGTNMACAQTNLTSGWLATQAQTGWHVIPTYVGLQAPGNTCGCAAIQPANATSEGTAAAQDAIAQAESLGLGPGNPIYDDMEAYPRTSGNTSPVLAFLAAWTQTLHASGYLSGVYSSENSGVADLITQYGTGYQEPDDIWVANWNGAQSTSDAAMPTSDWANHQRVHQYRGDHNETYGGRTMDVDSDYLDAATGASGTGTATVASPPPAVPPSLLVAPASDGSIALTPSWNGGPAVSSWQLLGGATPETLSPVTAPVSGGATRAVVIHSAYPYFEAEAQDGTGAVIGTSAVVTTPAHLTLAGATAFVPASGVGAVPIECVDTAACHISARIVSGRSTLALTNTVSVNPGAALLHFALRPAARRALIRSHHQTVLVRLRDSAGMVATKAMNLQLFHTSGASPTRASHPAASVAVAGLTDYVSNGWVGGLLTMCRATTPCRIAVTLTAGGTVIARTGAEYLGAGELGYLVFSLTPHGHALLRAAPGNQLAVQATSVNGSDTATAGAVLVAYP